MSAVSYTKSDTNTNPVPGLPSTHNQQTAGSASARQIRTASIHIAEARRLLRAEQRQILCRAIWMTIETVTAVCGRLVAVLGRLEEAMQ